MPKTCLLYVLPLGLFAACATLPGVAIGLSRDFWVPLLWGLIIPFINSRRWAGRTWAIKDFQNRDGYPPTIALLHASVWFLCVHLSPNTLLAMLAFFLFFNLFDWLMLRYETLIIYAAPVEIQRRGPGATLRAFGLGWWIYVSSGLAAAHVFGNDTFGSIALWSLLMIAPMQAILIFRFLRYDPPERVTNVGKVAVLGAGWSGIYATKWLNENGLDVTCFEAAEHIGGVWKYQESVPGGVFKNTRATSSKHFLHASDFPFDPSLSDFPHHTEILAYLESYIEHFGIRNRFQLGRRVVQVAKEGTGWRVGTESVTGERQDELFDAVVVSSGPHQTPKLDPTQDPLYGRFEGKLLHAAEYKNSEDIKRGELILVVGAGESSADIVNECLHAGAKMYWASRGGQWFADRNIGPHPADHFTSFGLRALLGRILFVEPLIRRFVIGEFITLMWGRGGHGIGKWIPNAPYLHQFVNKSRDAVLDVHSGKVTPMNRPVKIVGKKVYFDGGDEPIEVDRIILAVGYEPQWSFLNEPLPQRYKRVFRCDDPTLAFVGFARPILGSIPALSELQARWVAAVWSGQVALPSKARREAAIYWDDRFHRRSIRDPSRLGVLVDHETYATELASYVNAHVHWFRLLFRPRLLATVLVSPWIAFKYQLNAADPAKRAAAARHIRRELPPLGNPTFRLVAVMTLDAVVCTCALLVGLIFVPLSTLALMLAVWLLMVSCVLRLGQKLPKPRTRAIQSVPEPARRKAVVASAS